MLNKTLVLGIGNPLMQDDGIGVYVVNHLKTAPSKYESVEFVDGGTLSYTLIGEIEEAANLIIIDAAQIDDEPGAVQTFLGTDMDRILGKQKNSSVHDVTLVDLMSIALLSDRLPERRALIGVQPGSLDWGMQLTPSVEQAIPAVCMATLELIEKWQS